MKPTPQLDLFATGIICDHCKKDPGPDPRHGHLWNGFLDLDTQQHVCRACYNTHYKRKWQTNSIGLWSEFPVVVETYHLKQKILK